MNIRKIIKEEMDEFDWFKNHEPVHPLLFELQDTAKTYKIWFGDINSKEQDRIKKILFDLGLLQTNNIGQKVWLPYGGFDSLYFNYYDRHMGWGNEINKWNVSPMYCTKSYGAPPDVVVNSPEWKSEEYSSWKCREDGASYGEGLKYDKNYFDEHNGIELPSSLI